MWSAADDEFFEGLDAEAEAMAGVEFL